MWFISFEMMQMQHPSPEPDEAPGMEEALDADWGVHDPDPGAVLNQPGDGGWCPTPDPKARTLALEGAISQVRKEIGWLEAELASARRRPKQGKRKVLVRRGKIRRRFGLKTSQLTPRKLHSLLEKQRAILRVRVLQRQRARRLEKRRRERATFERQGTRGLREGSRVPVPTEAQAKETALFWRGIWESEGQGDTSHRAFAEWVEWARDRAGQCEGKRQLSLWLAEVGRT